MQLQPVTLGRSRYRPPASVQSDQCSIAIGGSGIREAMLVFSVALNTFCHAVLSLEGVKRVGFKERGESISVWTFVDDPSHEVLAKIYAAELVFRDAIPDIIFDFSVKYEDTATVPPNFYVFEG